MLTEAFPPGTKVLLHGDGPYTIAAAHRDEAGMLVYAFEEKSMRGYFWPAPEVERYKAPPKAEIPEDVKVPTEDTPERLEMIGEVAKALNDEVIRQAPKHVGDTSLLDYPPLARAAMDAIIKRIMMDMAGLNAMAAKVEEELKKDG